MADDVVSVQVTADVGSYVEGMKAAATATVTDMESVKAATTAAATQVVSGLAALQAGAKGVAESAREAGKAVGDLKDEVAPLAAVAHGGGEGIHSLGGAIKEYRQEIRQEGRYSRFLASDIASMGLASKGAASEVTGFVAAFAFGGGIGVAIEALKMGVKAIMEMNAEEAKFKDDVKKIWADATTAVASFHDEINKTILALSGAGQVELTWLSKVPPLLKEQQQLKQDQIAASRALSAAEEQAHAYVVANYHTEAEQSKAMESFTKKEREGYEKVTAALAAKTAQIAEAHEDIKKLKATVDTVESNKQDSTDATTAQQQNRVLLQLKAQLLTGEEKLEAEYAVKLQAIEDDSSLNQRQREARVAAESMIYVKQVVDYRNEQEAKWNSDLQRWRSANIKAELQASEALKRLRADQDAYQLERGKLDSKQVEEALHRQIQAFKEEAAVAKQVGDAIGQTFAGIVSGSLSAAKAFTNLASAGVKALFDIEIKTLEANAVTAASTATRATGDVMANAAVASSGAAASQASIPFIGPALAIAAMAAMEAAVLGLLSLIPGAAVGADIPAGMNPFIQAHGSEIVLPRISSDVLRSLPEAVAAFQSGGAGGGAQDIHIHNHFEAGTIVDQQTLDNHMQSGAMQQAISRAVRMSKWRG